MTMPMTEFIGRKEMLTSLEQWVVDKDARPIMYIHDEQAEVERRGGIGKTWLLREFRTRLEHNAHVVSVPIVDFFNVLDRDGLVITERFIEAIKARQPSWSFKNVDAILQQYQQKEAVKEVRDQLAEALTTDLGLLHQQMVETDTYLLLFFDTYELIEYNPISAVLYPSQPFPDRYGSDRVRAIITGRNPLDWTHQNWIRREDEVEVHTLPSFDLQETEQYLRDRLFDISSLTEHEVQLLREKTQGRPILLGLVTDVLNNDVRTLEALLTVDQEQFEASLVKDINHLWKVRTGIILTMAHIYHHFDVAFLHRLLTSPGLEKFLSNGNYQDVIEELPKLSFIRSTKSGTTFVLHDEMRRLINEHCWSEQDEDFRIRHILSQIAITHYNELLRQETNQEKQQGYIVERLYHELFIDPAAGFQTFEGYFKQAIGFSQRAFARILLEELKKLASRLSEDDYLSMQWAEAQVLIEEEKREAALDIIISLEKHPAWATRHRYDLLHEKGSCYFRLNRYDQAIECYEAGLQIAKEHDDRENQARFLVLLGYTYRVEGRYEKAMRYYEEALDVQRNLDEPAEYATLLNNIGNVLRLQGKQEEALHYCKLGLANRLELFEQGGLDERDVGLSQSTLGHIYHTLGYLREEEHAYQEAFKIYERVGQRSDLAAGYNCIGRVWVRKGNEQEACKAFKNAERLALGVSTVEKIESYNQQGRLDLRQHCLDTAREFFERAITLSRPHLRFQLAENLLYLADTLDQLDLPSDEQIEEAKQIAYENDYTYLLARVGEVQGDISWRRGRDSRAFKYYREMCRYTAIRGYPEFNRALNKLEDQLLAMPGPLRVGIIDALQTYWLELGLDKDHSQFLEMCRGIIRHMLL